MRIAAGFALLVSILFVFSLFYLVRPAVLEPFIKRTIQEELRLEPSYKELRLSLFPLPTLRFDSFKLTDPAAPEEAGPIFQSEQASFRISILSLLLGRMEIAHVYLKNASFHYFVPSAGEADAKTLVLDGIFLDLWNVGVNRPIHFKMRGKFLSSAENIAASGNFQTDFTHFDSEHSALEVKLSLNPIDLAKLNEWWGVLPAQIQKGRFTFSGEVKKISGFSPFHVSGRAQIGDFVYKLERQSQASVSGDYEAKFQAAFDLEEGSLVLQEGILDTPFGGPFQMNGKGNVREQSIEELYVQSKSLRLEAFPQYVLPLEEVMPVNLGFSGESRLDFFAKGNIGLLTLNGRVDLSDTTLTYSKYFSKPSGIPLVMKGELQLAAGRGLRGDFSVDFEQVTLKGSIVGVDLATGDGEFTILTNKFSIDGWEKYLIPFKPFALSGSAKVLTSMRGNLNKLEDAQLMNNITFEHIEAKGPNGAAISHLNGLIDIGPLDSELKDFHFQVGKSTFHVEGKMFMKPNVRWLARVRTPQLEVLDFMAELRKVTDALGETVPFDWSAVRQSAEKMIPKNMFLENVSGEFAYGARLSVIPELTFDVYDGKVSVQGKYDFSKEVPNSFLQLDVRNVNLAKWAGPDQKPTVDGTLFLTGTLNGSGPLDEKWPEHLTGMGSFSITNGEFHELDLLDGLAKIGGLSKLEPFQSGTTRFHDVRGELSVKNQKVKTDQLLIVSDDFQVEGAGDLGFDGSLNYRLSVYLMPSLSHKISSELDENERLGPIPLLVMGSIENPSVRPDPMLIETFVSSLAREQLSKITSRIPGPLDKTSEPKPAETTRDELMKSGFQVLEQFLSSKNETDGD